MTNDSPVEASKGVDDERSEPPALAWFNSLQSGNSGARARLRRCQSRLDAMQQPAAIELARRLGRLSKHSRHDDEAIGVALDLARVLSHVRSNDDTHSPMRAAGWSSFPSQRGTGESTNERPVLSEARFRRLLRTDGGEDLVVTFSRLVHQLDCEVNVAELSRAFLGWVDPTLGPQIKKQWAFEYFAANIAAPTEPQFHKEIDDV